MAFVLSWGEQGEVRGGRPDGKGRIKCANGDWLEGHFAGGSAAGAMRVCHAPYGSL